MQGPTLISKERPPSYVTVYNCSTVLIHQPSGPAGSRYIWMSAGDWNLLPVSFHYPAMALEQFRNADRS